VEGAAVVDATDGTGLEVLLLDAVLAPVGVPAHAAVSMIIAARKTDRFMVRTLFLGRDDCGELLGFCF
jgi:hypothetical protein